MKNAVIYARTTTNDIRMGYPELSIEGQISNCKAIAKQKRLNVIGECQDINSSGGLWWGDSELANYDNLTYEAFHHHRMPFLRAGLTKVLELIRNNKASIIIVDDIERLYKPIKHSIFASAFPQELKKIQANIVDCKGNNINYADAFLLIEMSESNKSDCKKLNSAESLYKKEDMRNHGVWLHRTPYGYTRYSKFRFFITDSKKEIIKHIFRSFLAGESPSKISTHLNSMKVRSPSNKKWTSISVTQLLKNPVYAGLMHDSKGNLIPCRSLQKVINYEQWDKVKDILEFYSKSSIRRSKRNDCLLSGLLYCGKCREMMVVNSSQRKHYYMCKQNTHKETCPYSVLDLFEIEDFFSQFISFDILNNHSPEECIELLNFHLDSYEDKIHGLMDKRSSMTSDSDFYNKSVKKKIIDALDSDIQSANQNIQDIKQILHDFEETLYAEDSISMVVSQAMLFPTYQRQMYLFSIIKRILVHHDLFEIIFRNNKVLKLSRESQTLIRHKIVPKNKTMSQYVYTDTNKIHTNFSTELEVLPNRKGCVLYIEDSLLTQKITVGKLKIITGAFHN